MRFNTTAPRFVAWETATHSVFTHPIDEHPTPLLSPGRSANGGGQLVPTVR